MTEHESAIDIAIAASASKAMYAGGGMAGTGFVLDNEFFGLVGLVIALAGFGVNLYYKRLENKRQELEHNARMGLYE